jgi:hypothetical protein
VLCKTVTLRLSAKGREIIMINAKKIEEIAKQVTESIPPSLKNMANDFEDKAKTVLQNKLAQLDVVTRDEFDIQTQVLIKTRAKLTELESKLAELEVKISGSELD